MKFVELLRGELDGDQYGSHGIEMCQLARLAAGSEVRVHIAWCAPGGVLGRHQAGLHQLFVVVSGSGWVTGSTSDRKPIAEGQAVTWLPGEMHEPGSETGMVVTDDRGQRDSIRALRSPRRPNTSDWDDTHPTPSRC